MIKIKQIVLKLFGYCPHCEKYFKYPQKRLVNSCYENEEDNYTKECKECYERTLEYFDAMWEDYYSGRH